MLLEIVHTDICGPMRVKSKEGSLYFITFIDDRSRWCEVYFLKKKSEALDAFKRYKAYVENQTGQKIKFLQSDNGSEYLSNEFNHFLDENGIGRRLTVPYTPQQNGVAERKNRTLLNAARCMLIQSKLSSNFWTEAILTANYVRNRCPSKSLNNETAFKLWTGRQPSVKHLRTFGSLALTLDKTPGKDKFDSRSRECIFLGYSAESKAFRLWLTDEQKIIISRDVKFLDKFIDALPSKRSENNDQEVESIDLEFDMPLNVPNPPCAVTAPTLRMKRGPGRPRKEMTGRKGRPRKIYNMVPSPVDETASFVVTPDPFNVKEARESPNWEEWREAIEQEYLAHIVNGTWELVDRPKHRKPISSRFVLRTKLKSDGSIEKRKARLVAKGYTQISGIDYQETYSPVARMSSIRLLLALAVEKKLVVHQMDVVTAYLNGTVEEDLYMEIPEDFESMISNIISKADEEKANENILRKCQQIKLKPQSGDKVCRLVKSLYGLKQSGRQWNKKLDVELKRIGLRKLHSDHCLYIQQEGDSLVIIAVYVDDILIAARSLTDMNRIKTSLKNIFDIKDLGPIHYCLGIEFKQDLEKGTITMGQKKYITEVLDRFGMIDCNSVGTPLVPGEKLKKNQTPQADDKNKFPYQNLIGSLNYLAVSTRPDISYAVSALSQFNSCYDETHWNAAKRILRYLKGTEDYGLRFVRTGEAIEGFVDADWANCEINRHSYTGFSFKFAGTAVSWEARKQSTVALSSTEAEYMALSEATKEAMYLRGFLKEIGIETGPIILNYDNRGAGELVKNPVFHNRTKHIDVRHHLVREAYEDKQVTLKRIPTEQMTADILTKSLSKPKHSFCSENLGVVNLCERQSFEGEC